MTTASHVNVLHTNLSEALVRARSHPELLKSMHLRQLKCASYHSMQVDIWKSGQKAMATN